MSCLAESYPTSQSTLPWHAWFEAPSTRWDSFGTFEHVELWNRSILVIDIGDRENEEGEEFDYRLSLFPRSFRTSSWYSVGQFPPVEDPCSFVAHDPDSYSRFRNPPDNANDDTSDPRLPSSRACNTSTCPIVSNRNLLGCAIQISSKEQKSMLLIARKQSLTRVLSMKSARSRKYLTKTIMLMYRRPSSNSTWSIPIYPLLIAYSNCWIAWFEYRQQLDQIDEIPLSRSA